MLAFAQLRVSEAVIAHNHQHVTQARAAAESGVELALSQLNAGVEAPFTVAAVYGSVGSSFTVNVQVDPADPTRRVAIATGSIANGHRTVAVTFEQAPGWAIVRGSWKEISS